jgi:hypothetical protein
MGDQTQLQSDADVDGVVKRPATGWDPYQVWSTRIRPPQLSIQIQAVGAVISERARSDICVSYYFHAVLTAAKVFGGLVFRRSH